MSDVLWDEATPQIHWNGQEGSGSKLNHYTLFVDEAGKFGYVDPGDDSYYRDRRWVVGGVLVPSPPDEAAKSVGDYFEKAANRHRKIMGPLPDRVLFHAMDLLPVLRETHTEEEAQRLRSAFIGDALSFLPDKMLFFAITNEKLISVAETEMTYRTMLTDLVALVDSTLTGKRTPDKLELVVARRTIDGEVLSPEGDLKTALHRIRTSLTVGLASLKLSNLLGSNKLPIRLTPAHASWGLNAADFVANSIFNREKRDAILEPFRASNRLFVEDWFGDSLERRAYVAWRDGDYVGALYGWSSLQEKEKDTFLTDVFREAFLYSGADNLRALTSSLIERFIREERFGTSHKALFAQLLRLVDALQNLIETDHLAQRLNPALFLLRTHALLVSNHLGSPPEAKSLFERQEQERTGLALTPENLPLLLAFDISFIETAVNALDFATALRRAARYRRLIGAYEACWEVTTEELSDLRADTDRAFRKSITYISAETAWLRIQLLISGLEVGEQTQRSDPLSIEAGLQTLLDNGLQANDRSRVRNHLIAIRLKRAAYAEALAVALENLDSNPNSFDIFWAARAACDAILIGDPALNPSIGAVCTYLEGGRCDAILKDLQHHPRELIFRERGLLEHLATGNKSKAKFYYLQSAEGHNNNSPIYRWLTAMLAQQKELLTSEPRDLTEVFAKGDPACRWLASQMPECTAANPKYAVLRRTRAVTPY